MTFHPSKRDLDRPIADLADAIGRLWGEACFHLLTDVNEKPRGRAERTEAARMDRDAARRPR
jgi:hypothetical protein